MTKSESWSNFMQKHGEQLYRDEEEAVSRRQQLVSPYGEKMEQLYREGHPNINHGDCEGCFWIGVLESLRESRNTIRHLEKALKELKPTPESHKESRDE